jgi:hypothetical protein
VSICVTIEEFNHDSRRAVTNDNAAIALHDPLDYRLRDVGRYTLLRELPEPTLYT